MAKKAPERSEREGLSVQQLFQMLPKETAARKWLEQIHWPDGQHDCPHCGSVKTAAVADECPMPYHCGCQEYFSVETGIVMQSSKVPLHKWVIAMYIISASGISVVQVHRDLGLTQNTAWLLTQQIRRNWIGGSNMLDGEAEVDGTYLGGERPLDTIKPMKLLAKGLNGKRLGYADLVAVS